MPACIRKSLPILTLILVASSGEKARAQYPDSVSISSPASGTTWVAGNGATCSAGVSGSTAVSLMRVTIYQTGNSSIQYFSNTSNYVPMFWYLNFTVPNVEPGIVTSCTLQIDAIGADGQTVVGSAKVDIGIAG